MQSLQLFNDARPRTLTDKLWRIDWTLLAVVVVIGAIGTATLVSVGGGSYQPWAERHALRVVVGIGLVIVMALVPLGVWLRLSYPAFLVGLVLLALVPLVGQEALGAKRWLAFGGMSFQPSEVVKIALVAALARYYQTLPPADVSKPLKVLPPLIMILAPMLLTLRQPDLGTSLLIAFTGFGLMFLAGVSWLYYIGGAVGAFVALPFVIERLHGYQRRRLEVFLEPEKDPLGAGYHITQSKIALGSGGVTGRGYMQGTQSQLDFVPEKHTDFIFANLGEEWGFIGTIVVVALFAALVGLVLLRALRARSPFARLLLAGFALSVLVYAGINMAMVTGVAPVVGVPLPFVSYGGTSMLSLMVLLGLAMSGHVHGHDRLPGAGPPRV